MFYQVNFGGLQFLFCLTLQKVLPENQKLRGIDFMKYPGRLWLKLTVKSKLQ